MSDQMATKLEEAPESAEPAVAPETPDVSGDQPSPQEPVAPESEGSELDQSTEPVAPEMVEVEYEGSTYSVPKELETAFMWQADYTRKSQENAEKRIELETKSSELQADREAFQQSMATHRENLQDYGQLTYLEQVLQQFREINLPELYQQDPDKAQEIAFQSQMAREQREQIVERIHQRDHDARLQAQRDHAKRKEQLQTTLARDIPNYSPEVHAKMVDTAVRHGFTTQQIEAVTDPAYLKILHLAHLGEQVLKKTAAPKSKPAEPVKPLPKAAAGPPPSGGPRDQDSVDSWMKRRNDQLRKRRA